MGSDSGESVPRQVVPSGARGGPDEDADLPHPSAESYTDVSARRGERRRFELGVTSRTARDTARWFAVNQEGPAGAVEGGQGHARRRRWVPSIRVRVCSSASCVRRREAQDGETLSAAHE